MRGIWLGGLSILLFFGASCGGGGGGPDSGQRGTFICQTTREDCLSIFQGTYSGSYTGSEEGTWSVYLAEDGSVEGFFLRSGGAPVPVTGSVDETGWVEFGSGTSASFAGAIDDQDLGGTWSGEAGQGTFDGSFVSRERVIETPDPGDDEGAPGGPEPGSFCERAVAKVAECGQHFEETCEEPVEEFDLCYRECLVELSCGELLGNDPGPAIDCEEGCE